MKKTRTLIRLMEHAIHVFPREFTGYELIKDKKMFSGTLYPLIRRLEREGYLSRRFEEKNELDDGRPARKFLKLTEKGRQLAIEIQRNEAELKTDLKPQSQGSFT